MFNLGKCSIQKVNSFGKLHTFLLISGTHEGDVAPASGGGGVTLYLNRHTGLHISCRVRFNLKIGGEAATNEDNYEHDCNGSGGAAAESGLLDEVSDPDGKSYGWQPKVKMADLVSKGVLRLVVDMYSFNAVS